MTDYLWHPRRLRLTYGCRLCQGGAVEQLVNGRDRKELPAEE